MRIKWSNSKFDFASLIAAAIVLLGSTPADALNSVDLSSIGQPVEVGSEFTLDLMLDFDEVTIGGGIEITFTPALTFVSFSFDPTFSANFGLMSPNVGESVLPLEIGFGWFGVSPLGGVMGQHTVGQLTFRVDGSTPSANISTSSSSITPGPFYGTGNFDPMAVQYGSSSVAIAAAVPEPQTAVLLGLGLLGLARVGRIRSFAGRTENRE